MCVISYSPKHTDIPTTAQLTAMWEHNPDGAGYAYIDHHKVIYRKGFMTLRALLDELEPQRASLKHKEFAVHFRITTAGKSDQYTTHPFPVTTQYHELRQTEGTTQAVLFHNGVLSDGGLVDAHSSDTQDFTVAMAPLLSHYTHSAARDYFVEELTQGSKLLILYGNGRVKRYGEWQKDGDLWVSNTYYKTYSSYPSQADSHSWWEDWYHSQHIDTTALWDKLFTDYTVYVKPTELEAMKRECDYYTADTLQIANYKFKYLDAGKDEYLIYEITENSL